MKKITLALVLFFPSYLISAQQSVAIGDANAKASAILYLKGNGNQGLILPIVGNRSSIAGTGAEKGMVVFDDSDDKIYYYDGNGWVGPVGAGGTSTTYNLDLSGTTVRLLLGTTVIGTANVQAVTIGGDLTGTVGNAQLAPGAVGNAEVAANANIIVNKFQPSAINGQVITTVAGTSQWATLPAITSDITTKTGALVGNGTAISGRTATAGSQYFRRNSSNTDFEFGTLIATDIPLLDVAKISTGNWPFGRITGAGAGIKAILGCDNNTIAWVTGGPNQLLGTDATGVMGFTDKSNFIFTSLNVLPKGSATGLVDSKIIDDGTNVGIGTVTPTRTLEVNSNGAIYGISHVDGAIRTSTYNGTLSGGGIGGSIGTESNHPFYIYVANSGEKATFLQNGDVGIGTNTPTARLEVNGDIKTGGNLILTDGTFTYTTSVTAGYNVRYGANSSLKVNGFNTTLGEGFVGGGARLTVGNSGDGSFAQANSWNLFSDVRLKQDITTIDNALSTVNKLRGVKFEWIKSGAADIGFIAQEVEKVIPEIVFTSEETGYKSVSYEKIVAVLVEALKEQQKTIRTLETTMHDNKLQQEEELGEIKAELQEIRKTLNLEASANQRK